MESPLIMRLLASSVSLASRASAIVRNVFASNDLGIVDKGVDDLQSRADRDAQRCIVGSLTQSFPGINIIGEEGKLNNTDFVSTSELDAQVLGCVCPAAYKSISLSDLTVWVDPLDGTKEYTEGFIEHVTVLIGIAVSGKPVAGVIAQPFHRGHLITSNGGSSPPSPSQTITRIVWALDGLGVFGVKPNPPTSPVPYPINPSLTVGAAPHVIVVTRSHPTVSLSAVIDACAPTEASHSSLSTYRLLCATPRIYCDSLFRRFFLKIIFLVQQGICSFLGDFNAAAMGFTCLPLTVDLSVLNVNSACALHFSYSGCKDALPKTKFEIKRLYCRAVNSETLNLVLFLGPYNQSIAYLPSCAYCAHFFFHQPAQVLRVGGCGYKVLLLLEGRAHVYLFPSIGTKRWDTCAPEAILNAAGGRLTDMWGRPYDYHAVTDPSNRNGILAVPVADWIPVYTELIPPEVLNSLSQ
ncbi:3'(2'), 5'-bisphosphate nucleotidase [Paragonimus westermani]|uniref:3'(2'),5'-bisphosphate nucleotidase 1 n=1 Tax=Paragonimus westermani TaxID=34504 RepID=A0A5J4N564_9TREM|nr:3'(2'), 5'-bisphosphate nucleotidase [Paragonimus westermani]